MNTTTSALFATAAANVAHVPADLTAALGDYALHPDKIGTTVVRNGVRAVVRQEPGSPYARFCFASEAGKTAFTGRCCFSTSAIRLKAGVVERDVGRYYASQWTGSYGYPDWQPVRPSADELVDWRAARASLRRAVQARNAE